ADTVADGIEPVIERDRRLADTTAQLRAFLPDRGEQPDRLLARQRHRAQPRQRQLTRPELDLLRLGDATCLDLLGHVILLGMDDRPWSVECPVMHAMQSRACASSIHTNERNRTAVGRSLAA